MAEDELITLTFWKEIAGIWFDGIFPSLPKVATPLFAAFWVASILLLKPVKSVALR